MTGTRTVWIGGMVTVSAVSSPGTLTVIDSDSPSGAQLASPARAASGRVAGARSADVRSIGARSALSVLASTRRSPSSLRGASGARSIGRGAGGGGAAAAIAAASSRRSSR